MKQLYTLRIDEDQRGDGVCDHHEKVESDWYEILEEEDALDHRFEVEVEYPIAGFKVCLICEMPDYSIKQEWLFSNKETAENHMIKAYSQTNNRLPFKVTEHTGAFRGPEKGYYPEISEEIKNMKSIDLPFRPNQSDVYYFMILVDSKDIIDSVVLAF